MKTLCITAVVTTIVSIVADQSLSFLTARAMNEQIPLKFRLVFAFMALIIIVVRRRLRQKRKEKEEAKREAALLSAYLAIHNVVMPDDEEDEEVKVVMAGFAAWKATKLAAEEEAHTVPDGTIVDFPREDGVDEVEMEVVDHQDVPQQPQAEGLANRIMAMMAAEIAKEATK